MSLLYILQCFFFIYLFYYYYFFFTFFVCFLDVVNCGHFNGYRLIITNPANSNPVNQ